MFYRDSLLVSLINSIFTRAIAMFYRDSLLVSLINSIFTPDITMFLHGFITSITD
jgi:hypothetical protein